MGDLIEKCPHCGLANGIYRNVRAFGWCQEYFDLDGNNLEMGTDTLHFTNSKLFRFEDCNKIIRTITTNEGGAPVIKGNESTEG